MKNKAAAFHPFAYLAAFGISGAMGGMLMCVNTLLMLDRGLSLAQVALGLSLFSITQVLLEVPSGMLGDLYGRKRIWMAAMLVRLCYLPLFLFASGPILLAGYVGNGAANALNSGTLDAMYLENWLHARGKKTLARGTALQQAVQYGSQAAGALLGGGLSNLWERLRHGRVLDYLRVPKAPGMLKRYTYNLADLAIFLGAALLVLRRRRR